MSKMIDLTNKRFGFLTVIEKDSTRKTSCSSYWLCKCDCGKIKSIRSDHLRQGKIISCGCKKKEILSQLKTEDLTGQRFGMLTVISKSEKRTNDNRVKWNCMCDCGNPTVVAAKELKNGGAMSCGCSHKSFGELEIEKILQDNNIKYIYQYKFTDLPNRYYDFAILDEKNNIIQLVEFDGEQHYKEVPSWTLSLQEVQQRDREKDKFAQSKNIPIIRIPYWEKGKITLDKILKKE